MHLCAQFVLDNLEPSVPPFSALTQVSGSEAGEVGCWVLSLGSALWVCTF